MTQSNARTLVLASASPRRKELIQKLGLPVITIPANVDETTSIEHPGEQVEQLSLRKASAVYQRLKDDSSMQLEQPIIVGSDTIVVKDGRVLGKPKHKQDAIDMLTMLSGDVHDVYTGLGLVDFATGEQLSAHRQTKVRFKPLLQEQIERYVNTGEPMDKAGAYGIQDRGALFVDSIEGCYFSVVGLPISLLGELLTKFGIKVI